MIVTHCHPDHIGLCGWLADEYGLIPHVKHDDKWVIDGRILRVADLHHHQGQRFETIAAVCERATTAAQLLPLLFKHKLDGYQLFVAMGETIAHLNFLARRGVPKRTEGSDGIYRFVREAALAICAGTN